ncbi:hypothetical protein [Mesorhizobium ventifaucium]|uniref:Uncharacterized protein n=1 Tax=Mesorhizobium ventifaucium TaxID=666020 RepID=A0ABM9DQY6_9HYPH|nr:hypothetical protein [Mesorhizobium ventifaucium]CAH2399083.1 hypothetical protein MES4922_210072 [Mesorhizobium ventifaucium]
MQYALVVVDGSVFKQNFDVYQELPAPESELGQDLVWEKAERHMQGTIVRMCVRLSERRSENPEATRRASAMVRKGSVLAVHRYQVSDH